MKIISLIIINIVNPCTIGKKNLAICSLQYIEACIVKEVREIMER